MHPLVILLVGIVTIIGLIVVFRVHAFVALISSAFVVGLLATTLPASETGSTPMRLGNAISTVAVEFGNATGKFGIVIALASIIGTCMMESGAADRIVRSLLRCLGERRAPVALTASGYILAIPVFFDTVFYLLVPLARSLYQRTQRRYLLSIMAIAAGGAITHTLVPPTPGPLVIAAQLNVDLGVMILMGIVVAIPAAAVGLLFSAWVDRRMPIPMREVPGMKVVEPLPDDRLPPLLLSLLPILLPVLLISANTAVEAGMKQSASTAQLVEYKPVFQLLGDPNFALFLAMIIAVGIYRRQKRATREQTLEMVETSLLSAGVIILITAAGGAFGAMLKAAQIGPAIEAHFAQLGGSGFAYLYLGFGISMVLKIAQGSSTVAMITTTSMLGAMLTSPASLGCHPVYLALAIGSGSLVGSWMNDSGFWIFAKMGGLTEVETLRSWTQLLAVLGGTGMIVTLILATLFPLVSIPS
jgi:GntP family gluconate:H+ symporter